MAVDRDTFLNTMSNVAATVTVVTTTDDDGHHSGLTVSAYSSVSLDPPLVLVCIGKDSTTLDPLLSNGGFTVNFMADGSDEVAMQLASKSDDKFRGLELYQPAVEGAGPVLVNETFAYFACRTRQEIDAGDHWVLLGEVEEAEVQDEPEPPLVYCRRAFMGIVARPPDDQSP